ncbi:MAG: phosphate ABC transporter substrate-binding protein PstS [Dehalococcoidia bacterium]
MGFRCRAAVFFAGMLLAMAAAGCSGGASAPALDGPLTTTSGKDDRASLNGAGATFPAILYQAWFYDYNHQVARNVRINYQAIGSGGGIQQFIEGSVDFGATDAPMSDKDLAKKPSVQHLPTVLGAVVLAYNIPGLAEPLRLDGTVVGGIYLGTITRWDDPAIAAMNPGVALPAEAISVVQRSDGSGTSFVFTDWLTKVNAAWAAKVGAAKSPNWPVGIGGRGNEGVSQLIRQTPYAIGYADYSYARQLGLQMALIQNKAGAFVAPTLEAVSAAASGAAIPEDYRASITNAEGAGAYPVSSFTFLLVDRESTACARTTVLLRMLWWTYHDEAAVAETRALDYAPLPAELLPRVEATMRSFTCKGEPLLPAAGDPVR